jgi:hypothetical protein
VNAVIFFVRILRTVVIQIVLFVPFFFPSVLMLAAATAARFSSVKMDPQARGPWRIEDKASACAAGRISRWKCAIADARSTARSRRVGRPGRRHGSVAGSPSHRTETTFVKPTTPLGYASGNGIIPATGAIPRAIGGVPYKTRFPRKHLNYIKKMPLYPYKTRFGCKAQC